jgi:hypothetical protein
MSEKTSVALLCPIAESIPPNVFQYTMAMVSKAAQDGIEISQVGVTERTLIQSARNILATGLMKTDCEWAFWMDADMIFPANTITRLLEVAKQKNTEFVTGIYYQRIGKHNPVLWKKDPETTDGLKVYSKDLDLSNCQNKNSAYVHHFVAPGPNAKEPFKADVCGFGCVLTHRSMFDKIPYPYFKMISGECSEDFYFCVEAKKAGYQLWADPTLRLGHVGPPKVVFREDYYTELQKMGKEIATIKLD